MQKSRELQKVASNLCHLGFGFTTKLIILFVLLESSNANFELA